MRFFKGLRLGLPISLVFWVIVFLMFTGCCPQTRKHESNYVFEWQKMRKDHWSHATLEDVDLVGETQTHLIFQWKVDGTKRYVRKEYVVITVKGGEIRSSNYKVEF